MQLLAYLLARFSEPSSYAGLGAILALLGLNCSDTTLGLIAQFVAAGCALAALFLKERGIVKSLVLTAGLAAAATLALTACQPPAGLAAAAASVDPALTAACNTAMALSPLAGPYAPWIIGGCGTAEAIAKLAADPSSLAWVNGLIADAEQLRASF